MGTRDEPEQPTIAGRALRALRTTRERADAEPVASVEPAPEAAESAKSVPVDLVKAPRSPAEPAPVVARRRNRLLLAAAVLVVAALAYAVVGLVVYLRGTDSPAAKTATARDDALTAARIDIATLNTLSYKDVKAGLQRWLNVTTGGFHDQIAQAAGQQASVIAEAKRTTVGTVVAAAVTELDTGRGTASVIATVDRTITPAGGTSALDRNRYRANLQQDHGVWKVADLEIVPVGLS